MGTHHSGKQALVNPFSPKLLIITAYLLVTPMIIVNDFLPFYTYLFSESIWHQLTTPNSALYHPLWRDVIFYESTVSVFLVLSYMWIMYAFVRKSNKFQTLFLVSNGIYVLLMIADVWAKCSIYPDTPIYETMFLKSMVLSAFNCIFMCYYIRTIEVKRALRQGY